MTDGLLFVYSDPGSDPGSVPEGEFHHWYDTEHGPARLAVPGIASGYRFQALDDLAPRWLATYDVDLAALASPAYTTLAADASDREKQIKSELLTLDRRVYELTSDHGSNDGGPLPVLLAVALSVPASAEADLAAWYADEHIPMLLAVPGWRRVRRFRRVEGSAPDFLALHELAGPGVFTEDGYRAAISTPCRTRIASSALRRERRVFAFRNEFRRDTVGRA
jgi:hypothetical protein